MPSSTRALVDRIPRPLRTPVALMVDTARKALAHRLPGLAAETAFWVLISLPALLLAIIAAAGAIVGQRELWREQLIERAAELSTVALTPQTIDAVVRPALRGLFDEGGVAVVSFGFLATVWAASRAVRVVLTTVALTADLQAVRPAWKDRLLGFGLTLGALTLGVLIGPMLLAGPGFGEQLDELLRTDTGPLAELWRALYWPASAAVAVAALAVLYHLGVPGRSPWRRDLPGAVLATLVWLAGSGGLRLYGAWVLDEESAYGPLAGPMVALLWLWLTAFAVLLGAEFNGQIEARWPSLGARGDPDTAGGNASKGPSG